MRGRVGLNLEQNGWSLGECERWEMLITETRTWKRCTASILLAGATGNGTRDLMALVVKNRWSTEFMYIFWPFAVYEIAVLSAPDAHGGALIQ